MQVLKGQAVEVRHRRKGNFTAVAMDDFDTDVDEFYPLALTTKIVEGLKSFWRADEEIPCRNSLCTISILEEINGQER